MVKVPSPQGKGPLDDPFAYFAAVVRGQIKVADRDLSALGNISPGLRGMHQTRHRSAGHQHFNVVVMRILDAAKRPAPTGKTVRLVPQ